jgi:predicted amidohydrolase YtcJ
MALDQALRAHTFYATTAISTEGQVGLLQTGKFGDVTIIDGDPEATPPERPASLGTWMTILDRYVVWSVAATAFRQ